MPIFGQILSNFWLKRVHSVCNTLLHLGVYTCFDCISIFRFIYTFSGDDREVVGRCYILKNAHAVGSRYEPCLGTNCPRTIVRDCLAGVSANYLKDGSQLYVGSPGIRYFRGSPIRGTKTDTCDNGLFRQDVGGEAYLGYAITSGRLFNQQKDIVVVSAPR